MEIVLGALVTAIGGVMVALIQRSRKENRTDHAMVVNGLKRIESKIDTHINDHATGKFHPAGDEVVVVFNETPPKKTAAKKSAATRKAAPKSAAPKKKAS